MTAKERLAACAHVSDAAAVHANLEAGYYDTRPEQLERDIAELEPSSSARAPRSMPRRPRPRSTASGVSTARRLRRRTCASMERTTPPATAPAIAGSARTRSTTTSSSRSTSALRSARGDQPNPHGLEV